MKSKNSDFIHKGAIAILGMTASCFLGWATWATNELYDLRKEKEAIEKVNEKIDKLDQKVDKIVFHLIPEGK